MSLAWPESIRLHLGRGFAFLQEGRREPRRVDMPATLPLARQLERLGALLEAKPRAKWWLSRPLHVSWSGAHCPAVGFLVAAGVKRHSERMEIARHGASVHWQVDRESIHCDFDPARPGVAAATLATSMAQVREWAEQKGCKLRSAAPLWSLGSDCRLARSAATLVVHEPDALTILCEPATGNVQAVTMPAEGDVEIGRERAAAWLAAQDVDGSRAVHLGFGLKAEPSLDGGPAWWRPYWSVL